MAPLVKVYIPLSLTYTLWKPVGCHIFELLYLQRQPCARLLSRSRLKIIQSLLPHLECTCGAPYHISLSLLSHLCISTPHKRRRRQRAVHPRCSLSGHSAILHRIGPLGRHPRMSTSTPYSPEMGSDATAAATSCPAAGRVMRFVLSKRVAQLMKGRDRR